MSITRKMQRAQKKKQKKEDKKVILTLQLRDFT